MDLLAMRVREVSLVFLDLETTGLKPEDGDEIIEFGAVKTAGAEEAAQMSTLIRPTRPIPPESAKVHGITDLFVMGAPGFDQAAGDILSFIGDAVIMAHNAPFDASFLAIGLQKLGITVPDNLVIDTVVLSRAVIPAMPNHKLETLKRHFDVRSDRAHRALDDSRALAAVFARILDAHFHAIEGGPTLGEVTSKVGGAYRLSDFAGGLPFKRAEERALVRWAMREKAELVVTQVVPGRLMPEEIRMVPVRVKPAADPVLEGRAKATDCSVVISRIKTIRRG